MLRVSAAAAPAALGRRDRPGLRLLRQQRLRSQRPFPGSPQPAGVPTASYNGGGFALFNSGNTTRGQTGRWQTTAPAGLEIVGATANQLVSTGVNDGEEYGGGFYWAGGGAGANDQSPSTLGMARSRSLELLRDAARLREEHVQSSRAAGRRRVLALRPRDEPARRFAAPTGLWQTIGLDQGRRGHSSSGATRHQVCARCRRRLNGQLIDTITSAQDVSTWHQCAAPPISQSIDTSRYGQGALPLTLGADDAAGVPASLTKTVYIDNTHADTFASVWSDGCAVDRRHSVRDRHRRRQSLRHRRHRLHRRRRPAQTLSRRERTGARSSGIGEHTVDCYGENNAVDPSGAHGTVGRGRAGR